MGVHRVRHWGSNSCLRTEGVLLEWNKLVQPVKSPPLPDNIGRISTPLQLPAWAKALKHYPNKEVALFFLGEIAHGFRIGFILVLGNITILP